MEDQDEMPVFSEGPDGETAVPRMSPERSDSRPALPLLAQVPTPDGGLPSQQHRRRRRRRRGRGRGAGPGGAPSSSDAAAGNRWSGNTHRDGTPPASGREPMSRPEPRPAPTTTYSSPPPEQPRPAPVAQQADGGGKGQEDPKPKRTWWRRTFGS